MFHMFAPQFLNAFHPVSKFIPGKIKFLLEQGHKV